MFRTLVFLFFSQLISTTGSWDRLPVHLVTMVTMGPVCLMKLTRKWKLVRTHVFFLDFFPQLISTTGSWDRPPVYMVTMGPVGTSVVTVCWNVVSILLCQGKSFLSDKWLKSLEIPAFKSWWGGWVATLIIVSLKVLPFEFLTLNLEYWVWLAYGHWPGHWPGPWPGPWPNPTPLVVGGVGRQIIQKQNISKEIKKTILIL